MTDQPTGDPRCAVCGSRWTPLGMRWLVTDVHGRLSTQDGPAVLARCPVCQAVQQAGKATVTEEPR